MSGTISLALVNVPVKLYTAQKENDLSFNQINSKTGNRVSLRKVDAGDGSPVVDSDIVKGYDVGGGTYVHLTPDEIASAKPPKSDVSAIDPIHFDRTYYILPNKGGAKSYALLTAALTKAKRVGIGKLTMRAKQHVVAIRAVEGMLTVTTLFMPDEIVEIPLDDAPPDIKAVDKRELEMALQLIGIKTAEDWDPSAYTDQYRANVMAMIESKAKGQAIPSVAAAAAVPVTTDIFTALAASLEEAKKRVKTPA